MSDKVYLERINNDILVLAVYDACWMQEERWKIVRAVERCVNVTNLRRIQAVLHEGQND